MITRYLEDVTKQLIITSLKLVIQPVVNIRDFCDMYVDYRSLRSEIVHVHFDGKHTGRNQSLFGQTDR